MAGQLATDAAGNLYVVDGLYYSAKLGPTIRKITPEGVVSTLAGNPNAAPGHADGVGAAALFSVDWRESLKTASLAVDKNGNVYVSDPANGVIRFAKPMGLKPLQRPSFERHACQLPGDLPQAFRCRGIQCLRRHLRGGWVSAHLTHPVWTVIRSTLGHG